MYIPRAESSASADRQSLSTSVDGGEGMQDSPHTY